jgi:hypothetical protein
MWYIIILWSMVCLRDLLNMPREMNIGHKMQIGCSGLWSTLGYYHFLHIRTTTICSQPFLKPDSSLQQGSIGLARGILNMHRQWLFTEMHIDCRGLWSILGYYHFLHFRTTTICSQPFLKPDSSLQQGSSGLARENFEYAQAVIIHWNAYWLQGFMVNSGLLSFPVL